MKGEAGFTLVELLAALVAGGMLLAILGAMTGMFGVEVRRSAENDRFGELAAAAPLLDTLLSTAVVGPEAGEPVEGDPDHLTTYVDPPLSRRGAGLMKLELTVARERDGDALDLTLTQPDEGEAAAPPTTRRLVKGMKAIDIALDREGTDAKQPPRLITLAFKTQTDEAWEIAVEPRLTGAGGCRFDPISLTCRP